MLCRRGQRFHRRTIMSVVGGLLSLLLLVLPMAAQERSAPVVDAPTWFVGDTWVFRLRGDIAKYTVIATDADSYTVSRQGATRTLAVRYTRTLNADTKGITWAHFVWPLRVGAAWSRPFTSSRMTMWTLDYKVIGYGPVSVTAGTFDAFQIAIRECQVRDRTICPGLMLWYAPAVKSWIKEEWDTSPYWDDRVRGQSNELISYSVTPSP